MPSELKFFRWAEKKEDRIELGRLMDKRLSFTLTMIYLLVVVRLYFVDR